MTTLRSRGGVGWPAATRRGHHAAAAPFWGMRCPSGGGGKVAVTRTCGMGALGPSPRRSGGHAQRGGASDSPGCQQAQHPPPRPGVGFLRPRHCTPDGWQGLEQGTFTLRPGALDQGVGGPPLPRVLGSVGPRPPSAPSLSLPSHCLLPRVTVSKPPPMRTSPHTGQ